MESEEECTSDFVKEEEESFDEIDSQSLTMDCGLRSQTAGQASQAKHLVSTPAPVTIVHYHPANWIINENASSPTSQTVFQGHQRSILPRTMGLQHDLSPRETEKRNSQVGDYLDFVIWIRSLLIEMYPSLSELAEDVPLLGDIKWTERHAWGRNVDEKCPSCWRRFRLKEAKRLSAVSKRCFDIMLSIGTKILRGDLKKSTISREAGSTTFDFLSKKTEGEMFHALNLVESGQVYIKDVNSFARSQREKRGPHNEEEFSEESGLMCNLDAISTASPQKRPRGSTESPLGSATSVAEDLPTMVLNEEHRREDKIVRHGQRSTNNPTKCVEDCRLTRIAQDLKEELKATRDELLKVQEKVHELEEENEVLSSLLTDHRVFQQQQQEIYKRRIKLKEKTIQRLKRDIGRLTNAGEDRERAIATITGNEENSKDLKGRLNQNAKEVGGRRKEIKVGNFVLYRTSNGKFYMGKVTDTSDQLDVLSVSYAESKTGLHHDFSQTNTALVTKESVFRWGSLEDVGALCIDENLFRLNTGEMQ